MLGSIPLMISSIFGRSHRNTLTMRALSGAQTRKLEIQSWETRCGHARASLSHRCWPLGSPCIRAGSPPSSLRTAESRIYTFSPFTVLHYLALKRLRLFSLFPFFSVSFPVLLHNLQPRHRKHLPLNQTTCHLSIFTYFRKLRCKYGCPQVLPMDVGAVSSHFATHCREPHSRVRLSLRELLCR